MKNRTTLGLIAATAAVVAATTFATVPAKAGPGFNCSKARTTNEHLICANSFLWPIDRRLNRWYKKARQVTSRAARRDLKREQRQWIGDRNNCGNDLVCTENSYDDRIAELKNLHYVWTH